MKLFKLLVAIVDILLDLGSLELHVAPSGISFFKAFGKFLAALYGSLALIAKGFDPVIYCTYLCF